MVLRTRSPSRGLAPLPLVGFAAVLGLLALFPAAVSSTYALHVMILIFLAVIQGESWNVVGGYTGQYSVGHAAYFGMGAYVTMMLLQFKNIAPWYGMWVAVAASIVLGLVIGSITFRLRGPYFVLASIAVAEIIRLVTLNWKEVTNGAEGILLSGIPPLQLGGKVITDWSSKVPFYYAALGLAALTIAVNYGVQHSKLGYYFQAIREDQDAAHSLGIHIAAYKGFGIITTPMAFPEVFTALQQGTVDGQENPLSGIIAAKFKRSASIARFFGNEFANLHAARERDEFDIGIGDHFVAD